jgi:hypothetical protein
MPIWTPPSKLSSAALPSNPALEDFLVRARAASTPRGRLIFALDATDSRRPTWDRAAALTGEMFDAVTTIPSARLDVQLVYFRGLDECKASQWFSDANSLKSVMTKITTESGETQIGKVLQHTIKETASRQIGALVYVGDCVEEYPEHLYTQASDLPVPMFLFQEHNDPEASIAFPKLARLTGGAHARFDHSASDRLRDLLAAVALFATGGVKALESQSSFAARCLAHPAQIVAEFEVRAPWHSIPSLPCSSANCCSPPSLTATALTKKA